MPYWWDDNPDERYWVEIRYIEGIGRSLQAPFLDERQKRNAWYDLVEEVDIGDVVYHWNAIEHRFVGRSTVASRPTERGGQRWVDLSDFQALTASVDLDTIQSREEDIVAVRDRLREAYPRQKLYLSFQFRGDGLRMLSNYFAKLPAELVALLFDPTGFGEEAAHDPPAEDGPAIVGGKTGVGRTFLSPFKPKADTNYNALVKGGVQRRGRDHETLVNDFAEWLVERGLEVGRNAAIDLAVISPLVVVEAKMVTNWSRSIREAVGQLYEYRYFNVIDPSAALIFLASGSAPQQWIDYLEVDRKIGIASRSAASFDLSRLARSALAIAG